MYCAQGNPILLSFWKVSQSIAEQALSWAHGQSYIILTDTALQKRLRPGHSLQDWKGGGRVRRAPTEAGSNLVCFSFLEQSRLTLQWLWWVMKEGCLLNIQVLLTKMFSPSALQLQSIIKKVIAHFHDFSVLFSVVSSISQWPLETVSSGAVMVSWHLGQEYSVPCVKHLGPVTLTSNCLIWLKHHLEIRYLQTEWRLLFLSNFFLIGGCAPHLVADWAPIVQMLHAWCFVLGLRVIHTYIEWDSLSRDPCLNRIQIHFICIFAQRQGLM